MVVVATKSWETDSVDFAFSELFGPRVSSNLTTIQSFFNGIPDSEWAITASCDIGHIRHRPTESNLLLCSPYCEDSNDDKKVEHCVAVFRAFREDVRSASPDESVHQC
jgi:hypothetical protein